ncbi:glycoside hydrolase family 13 protein [Microlunatus sp. Y2014]|uniref:glycoside hydrolase family 13 protein n=1 Tax=Microlunatus sp. Y2014 TaxID=3418488 RepID=UPI003DA74B41
MSADWWRQAVVYQVYPRSFADGNADGIGDLAGLLDRIDHLVELGVDAVWLSPFYPSALADGGYDVDDYCDVDPRIGTLAEFDALVARLHEAGLRLIVDIVPNHSSDRHAWFVEALASPPGSPARDRYVFRDGVGPDGDQPPSDWEAMFGGSAWQPVGDGQFYLHLFAPEQPDFNWDNPEVRQEFLRVLTFWADRGVDGFRIDVAHALAKDLSEPLPSHAEVEQLLDGHSPLWDRDEVHDIYAEWRELFDRYDPPRIAIAEAWVPAHRRPRYASADGLGQAFNFDLLETDFEAGRFREIVTTNLALAAESGSSSTWVLSNHDVVRHPTRYGLPALATDEPTPPSAGVRHQNGRNWLNSGAPADQLDLTRGLRRARAATLFMLALPGSAYLYQGEELGLFEVADIPDEARQDPTFFRNAGVDVGRDGCRVPLPWTPDGSSYGFGDDGAHLPQPDWFGRLSVAGQVGDADSTLELYRAALTLRREWQTAESLEWLTPPEPVEWTLAFRRPNGWTCLTNFGADPVALPAGTVMISSQPITGDEVPGETTVWLHD